MAEMKTADDDKRLLQARRAAAAYYRKDGFPDYAARVERGEADDCQAMRVAMSRLMLRSRASGADEESSAESERRTAPLRAIVHH